MVAAMGETVHTAAQKAVQDRRMSGHVDEATKSSYQMAACVCFDWRTPPGSGLGPAVVPNPVANKETTIMCVRWAVVEAEGQRTYG
jgi:hypothetical protein